jgi:hypothetical protein
LTLAPGPGTPSRTLAQYPIVPAVFQPSPLDRSRPALRSETRNAPRAVRVVPPGEADALIDLAREAMVTRARDLAISSTPIATTSGSSSTRTACRSPVTG